MSRSAPARFTELVGEPVMQYVTRWRMQVALDWLRTDDVPVAELATRLGYESQAALAEPSNAWSASPPAPRAGHRPTRGARVRTSPRPDATGIACSAWRQRRHPVAWTASPWTMTRAEL